MVLDTQLLKLFFLLLLCPWVTMQSPGKSTPSLLLFRLVFPYALILSHNCNRTQITQCHGDDTSGLKVTFSYGRPRALCLPELRHFRCTAATGPCDTALELTSFLVNFGEWSFLSSITMVAVAVPVNPTSNPAISWASMISSYLGFSRVYKAKTHQRRLGLDVRHCFGELASVVPMP